MVKLLVITHTKDTSNIWIDYLWNDLQELKANNQLDVTVVTEQNINRLKSEIFDSILYVGSSSVKEELRDLVDEYDIRFSGDWKRFLFFGPESSTLKVDEILAWYHSKQSYKTMVGVEVGSTTDKDSRFKLWNQILA